VLASTSLAPRGGPPWSFSLHYDPGRLQDKRRYALRARIEADGRLLFTSTDHIPAFDRNDSSPVNIQVTPVGGGRTPPAPDVSLTDTYWKLTQIDSEPATLGAGGREVHMVLTSEGARLRGFSGCNRFTGSYELGGRRLRFGQLASTRMACVEGMEQEQRFLTLLAGAVRYIITGNVMSLYDGGGQLILRFRAVALT
jgi:putative lipoprotein